MHSITLEDWNLSLVAISDSKDLYPASSSSVNTKRFIEQTLSPYSSKKARWKIAWKKHFFTEGIIEKFPGKVFPQGVLTAITNNSFLCLLVPADWDDIWIHILETHMNSYVTNTMNSYEIWIHMHSPAVVSINQTSGYIETRRIISSLAIDTRTSILHLSFSKTSFLRPAISSSICRTSDSPTSTNLSINGGDYLPWPVLVTLNRWEPNPIQ